MSDPLIDFLPQLINLSVDQDEPQLLSNLTKALSDGTAQIGVELPDTLCIIQPLKHQELLVWVVVSDEYDCLRKYQRNFEYVARRCGYKAIVFKTKRRGFKRLGPTLGFTETRQQDGFFVFRKEV